MSDNLGRELLKGNYAIAEAAVRAGLDAYFGYPITPQTEVLEWLSKRLPDEGRVFLQAESEIAAINMAYGAACTGSRVMVSSSGPGSSLMVEGLSYIAGTELPLVVLSVMRAGPGLGNIGPAQSDYYQFVKPGGHGDYRQIVLAPWNIQEAINLTIRAFDLAEKYRMITVILIDGAMGQLMEPAELPPIKKSTSDYPDWAIRGASGHEPKTLSSFDLDPSRLEKMNFRRFRTWQQVEKEEIAFEEYFLDDAEIAVIAYGSVGRIALSAVRDARREGIKAGLFRPITLSPFPRERIREISKSAKSILVAEMSAGQMLDDVIMAAGGRTNVEFYGRLGGVAPFPGELFEEINRLDGGEKLCFEDPRSRWISRMLKEIEV